MSDKINELLYKIIKFCLSVIMKPFHKEVSDNVVETLCQFVKFGLVGVTNTIVSYGVYAVSLIIIKNSFSGIKYEYIIAQVISFILSVLWSFYWNNKVVFTLESGKERSLWSSLIKTYITYSFTGLFLNSILLVLWIQVLGISDFVAPIINAIIGIPINFLINKYWAFSQK